MTFTMSRLQMYIASSAVLANIVLVRAFVERPNFYSAAVYISQSTGSILFLANLALIVMGSVGYGLQRLFYGPLRPIETEQLYDKAWFAVSETLLAMTIFRDDIGLWFFAMFLCLLAGKVWQWIGEGRVEFLEQQPPANPKLFHARLMSSLLLSVGYDLFMVFYCVDSILADARAGVMVMFGFEYVLLAIASISALLRYGLSLVELAITHRQEQARDEVRRVAREQARQRREAAEAAGEPIAEEEDEDDHDDDDVPGWEEKGRWVFFLDLMTDAIKSIVYMVFFFLLLTFYGIPIHIVRDLFMTLRSFVKRLHDFYQYRNATRDMNARYPDATAEELERENTCIVCREEMQPWVEPGADAAQPGRRRMDERQRAKKLPCGHILHFNCLRSWLERQQVCPTCRRSVLAPATAPTNHQNQANAGQLNPPALPGEGPLRGLLGNMQPPAAPAQPGQYQPAPQAGQQGQPQGNVRVFNFGPVRIALGNMRLPANRPADGNANAANNLLIERLAQQIAQQQNPLQPQHQVQNQGVPQLPNAFNPPFIGGVPHHPNDIQGDILRIQQNIIVSMQHLENQHNQLENIRALLAELNRLQQASGAAAAGQDLPPIASLNPQSIPPMNPQAYFANGPVLRQGDAGVPEGLTLPEGWTLRPMALSPQPASTEAPVPTEPGPSGTARRYFPAVQRSPAPVPAPSSSPPPVSNSTAGPTATAAAPSEPSSLGSSWSFDNAGNNEAEGSSSAVAGSSSEGQGPQQLRSRPSAAGSSVPRPVTVEETDDE